LKKIEKILITLIFWPYFGFFIAIIFGGLFGGRGGYLFFDVLFLAGCAIGLLRTIYLGFTYDEKLVARSTSKIRVAVRRIFFGLLYAPVLYFGFRHLVS